MIITGKVWKYGDDVNTDVIYPGRYTYQLLDEKQIASHALEDLDPSFSTDFMAGDIVVGGKNWGCGSAREQAVKTLKYSGVSAIIAKSFARIYFRNCLNEGLLAITCPEAVEAVTKGETVSIDVENHRVKTDHGTFDFPSYPEYVMELVKAGGIVPFTKKKVNEKNRKRCSLPIGKHEQTVYLPKSSEILLPPQTEVVNDIKAEIRRAINEPIGSKKLSELAKGKHTAAIVINDITRPYPGKEMVEVIADELNRSDIPDENITLVIAYGHHRDNTREELISMLGEKNLNRFRIEHHHATDPNSLITIGRTSMGIDVQINRVFAESDVKITTGCITPHQLAGFSGGRKSILPGISGMDALRKHHSLPIRPDHTSLGWYKDNPFHTQSLEAAKIAGVDFIVNSVDNANRDVVACVAGDVEKAHEEGISICRKVWSVNVRGKGDIVIVSPGGYPRDFDLHQSQKALGCAEVLCKENGTIILCAEMIDGEGRPGKVLLENDTPESVIKAFIETGYTPHALSKAYMIARALKNHRIIVVGSRVSEDKLIKMGFMTGENLQEVLDMEMKKQPNAKIIVAPYASDILPEIVE